MRTSFAVLALSAGIGCTVHASSDVAERPTTPGESSTPVASAPATTAPAPRLLARFAAISIAPGLTAAHEERGAAGGNVDAATLSPECTGYVTQSPNHELTIDGHFDALRLLVDGGQNDLSLIVRRPDGTYLCNADAEGAHPILAGAFDAGTYYVWIGNAAPNANGIYTLALTESADLTVQQMIAAREAAHAPNVAAGAEISLGPGFMPDPMIASGNAGGAVEAFNLGPGCAGRVASSPSHVLQVTSDFTFLRIFAESVGDTTLVVQGPGGTRCNDDTAGLNPMIEGRFVAGTYRIFVGSFRENESPAYRLSLTELQSTRPSSHN